MAENSGPKPEVPYWHLWRDADGVSHQTRCTLDGVYAEGCR